jgi:hypothetical protein
MIKCDSHGKFRDIRTGRYVSKCAAIAYTCKVAIALVSGDHRKPDRRQGENVPHHEEENQS